MVSKTGDQSAAADATRVSEDRTEAPSLGAFEDRGLVQVLKQVPAAFGHYFWNSHWLDKWLDDQSPESLDLRHFAQAFTEIGIPLRNLASACLINNLDDSFPMDRIAAQGIWPLFAEHLEWLREGLGLIPSAAVRSPPFDFGLTLRVLATFPTLPAEFVPTLLDLALGEAKSHRQAAQELLRDLPGIGERALEALATTRAEARIVAIQWLVDLAHRPALPELRKLLATESRETVRAALLGALEQFGEDTTQWLNPASLLCEASKGLKLKLPSDITWFNFELLPAARWRDGQPIAAEILNWWVVLAAKLKSASSAGLLQRYLQLLDADSGAALGRSVLSQWITQDTLRVGLEEANAYAAERVDQQYLAQQQWAQQNPELAQRHPPRSRDEIFDNYRQQVLGNYQGSAIAAKGILALIFRVPGQELASALNAFMRDHPLRRAQIEALLEAIAGSDDPAALQVLIAIARRHRTAAVQAKARQLVDSCAQRLGWSAEQLADRSIPSGGLDDSGVLTLSYGSRGFEVRLDAAMKAELRAEDGKLLKALPDPRQDEDPALAKEAKSQLAACKKELKQVIDLQSARLYEAMCAQRAWPLSEWRDFLHAHPIVGRLCQRLIWSLSHADESIATRQFRPSEDGTLLDEQDREIELPVEGQITVAHATLLSEAQRRAWKTHLKDYKIKPLFAQLDRLAPPIKDPQDSDLSDRVGWCADAFSKLGYLRGQSEDGGWFYDYSKSLSGLGIGVRIEVSGNRLPEENLPVALKGLSFRRLDGRRSVLKLAEVPVVLLAEAYADYLQVAASGTGFDPSWESKLR